MINGGQTLGRCVRPAFLVALIERAAGLLTHSNMHGSIPCTEKGLFLPLCVRARAHMCICALGGQKRGSGSSVAGITGSCESLRSGSWELNLGTVHRGAVLRPERALSTVAGSVNTAALRRRCSEISAFPKWKLRHSKGACMLQCHTLGHRERSGVGIQAASHHPL